MYVIRAVVLHPERRDEVEYELTRWSESISQARKRAKRIANLLKLRVQDAYPTCVRIYKVPDSLDSPTKRVEAFPIPRRQSCLVG